MQRRVADHLRTRPRNAEVIVGSALAFVAFWIFRELVLVVVGACVVSALLHLGAEPITRVTKASRWLSLLCSGCVILAIVGLCFWFFGMQIASEASDVLARAQAAVTALKGDLSHSALSGMFAHFNALSDVEPLLGNAFITAGHLLEGAIVMVIMGVYIAVEPRLYRSGLVLLLPTHLRCRADRTVFLMAQALRYWLLGQMIQMVIIGILSFLATRLIGVPSALALGVLAGICEFIPYVGPIIAAVPAVLVAFTQSPSTALWTILAFIAIHQVEGQILAPLVQRRMVFVPPALLLGGLLGVQLLFGTAGVIFAGPITVLVHVAISKLYARDVLGETVALPERGSCPAAHRLQKRQKRNHSDRSTAWPAKPNAQFTWAR